MKTKYLLPVLALALAACSTTSLTEEEQAPAPESDATFTGQHTEMDESQSVLSFIGTSNIINHEGKFNDFSVEIDTDATAPADLTKATIIVTAEVASIETDAGVSGHLQREDFFDVENYPTVTFVTTSIVSKGDDVYTLTGDMTVKGKTMEMSFDAVITDEVLTTAFDFPRKEFGVGNDSYGDKLLDENVPVTVKVFFL